MSKGAEARYKAKAYETITINVPRGAKAVFSQKCKDNGSTMYSVLNAFIREYTGTTKENWTYKYFQNTEED